MATFLYDGDCGFCMRWVRWFRARVGEGVVFRAFSSAEAEIARVGLTVEECRRAAYLIDESAVNGPRVYGGAAAVNFLLRQMPGRRRVGWRWLGRAYRVPGIRQVEDLGYRWVAKNRMRFAGDGAACAVEG